MNAEFYARFLDKTRAVIDGDPVLRLAISLSSLRHTDDAHTMGVDLVESYVHEEDHSQLSGTVRDDALKLRGALDILSGRTLVGGVEYYNLSVNVRDAGGGFLSDMVPDTLAREIVGRLLAAMPDLAAEATERGLEVPF
ncbi:hypothetical protein [Arthrobacter sp. H14]|uniref:hypothetical protein n=1 Tax=Arthrobacter sp. H14 TaxID=1312959 RepID=UPI00047EF512|nr:hypothetical protein [Arthrobacter sp. H14]